MSSRLQRATKVARFLFAKKIIVRLSLRDNCFFIRIKMFKRDAGATRDAKERFVSDSRLHACAAQDKLRKISELRGTACHRNPAVDDICRELGRGFLQHVANRLNNFSKLLPHCFHHIICADFGHARESREEIAATHGHHELLFHGYCGTDAYFYILGGFLSDAEIKRFLHVVRDRVVEPVARTLNTR
jgi:hypothetical protein